MGSPNKCAEILKDIASVGVDHLLLNPVHAFEKQLEAVAEIVSLKYHGLVVGQIHEFCGQSRQAHVDDAMRARVLCPSPHPGSHSLRHQNLLVPQGALSNLVC